MNKGKKVDDTKIRSWTEADRLELAAKLDKELEDYIDNLDKKSYKDGWPEERWQEEMEKHPFFMTKFPENPSQVSPLVEGLQQLKYSEEYNTPNELAQSYKEEGNFSYKHKKYRLAILSFSKGIAYKCEDKGLLSQLYNNRALAQFKLKNYRSSLNDCKQALKLKPDYLKVLHTAAKCSFNTKDYDQCIAFCDQILNILAKTKEVDKDVASLRAQAAKDKKILRRNFRVQELREKKNENAKENIINAIKSRRTKVDKSDLFYDKDCHVHLDEENVLVWPVIFAYPENSQRDLIKNFDERTVFKEQLEELFQEPPAWDTNRRYQLNNLNIYFEGIDKKAYKVDVNETLRIVLQNEKLVIKNGTPWFFVLVSNSKEEVSFLKSYR